MVAFLQFVSKLCSYSFHANLFRAFGVQLGNLFLLLFYLKVFRCISFDQSLKPDLGMRLSAFLNRLNNIMELIFGVIGVDLVWVEFMTVGMSQIDSHVAFDESSLIFFSEKGCEHV